MSSNFSIIYIFISSFGIALSIRRIVVMKGKINAIDAMTLTFAFFLLGNSLNIFFQPSYNQFYYINDIDRELNSLSFSIITNIFIQIFFVPAKSGASGFPKKLWKIKTLPLIIIISIGLTIHFVSFGLSLDIFSNQGSDRNSIRSSNQLTLFINFYIYTILWIYATSIEGRISGRNILILLIPIITALSIGFRALLLTPILAALILYIGKSNSKKRTIYTLIMTIVAIFALICILTLTRPELQSAGLFGALINRIFNTPLYQMEVARSFFSEQAYPGQWIVNEFLSRIGYHDNTLSRVVYLTDAQFSNAGTGSYPYLGDLYGNFGSYWVIVYLIFAIVVALIDISLTAEKYNYEPVGIFLRTSLALMVFRISFFNLGSVVVFSTIVLAFYFLLKIDLIRNTIFQKA